MKKLLFVFLLLSACSYVQAQAGETLGKGGAEDARIQGENV